MMQWPPNSAHASRRDSPFVRTLRRRVRRLRLGESADSEAAASGLPVAGPAAPRRAESASRSPSESLQAPGDTRNYRYEE